MTTNEVDVMMVDPTNAPSKLPPNGYTVTTKSGETTPFRCGECVCSVWPGCDCIWSAFAFARRSGEGAKVMRGRTVLAVTARRYAEVGEADVANGRRAKRARVAS